MDDNFKVYCFLSDEKLCWEIGDGKKIKILTERFIFKKLKDLLLLQELRKFDVGEFWHILGLFAFAIEKNLYWKMWLIWHGFESSPILNTLIRYNW